MNLIITNLFHDQNIGDDQFICAAKVDGEGETAILLVLLALNPGQTRLIRVFNPDQIRLIRFQP